MLYGQGQRMAELGKAFHELVQAGKVEGDFAQSIYEVVGLTEEVLSKAAIEATHKDLALMAAKALGRETKAGSVSELASQAWSKEEQKELEAYARDVRSTGDDFLEAQSAINQVLPIREQAGLKTEKERIEDALRELYYQKPLEISFEGALQEDFKAAKASVRLEYKKHQGTQTSPKIAAITPDGIPVQFGSKGLRKASSTLGENVKREKLVVIANAKSLLERAIYLDSEVNTKPDTKSGVQEYRYYGTKTSVLGQEYYLTLTLEKQKDHWFYDAALELVPEKGETSTPQGEPTYKWGKEKESSPKTRLQKIMDKVKGEETNNADISFSIAPLEEQAWKESLGNYLTHGIRERAQRAIPLKMSSTPAVLRALGFSARDLVMTPATIDKVMGGKHDLTREQLERLPAAIHDPIMIVDSRTEADALVVLTEIRAIQGNIIAAVHLDKNTTTGVYHVVASAYNKSGSSMFVQQMQAGKLRFLDKKKALVWARSSRLQLPSVASQKGKAKILTPEDVVKWEGENNADISFSVASSEVLDAFKEGVLEVENALISKPGLDVSFSIAAMHASPHKFDKFSTDYMGSGEGAQAYGWGLYFSTNKEVNEDYVRKFSEGGEEARSAFQYKVELAVDDVDLLDWDKEGIPQPLQERIESLLKEEPDYFFASTYSSHFEGYMDVMRGKDLYNRLFDGANDPEGASEMLAQLGIKGIKYEDGFSRKEGKEKTFNYVIFDAHDIKVLETHPSDKNQKVNGEISFSMSVNGADVDLRQCHAVDAQGKKLDKDTYITTPKGSLDWFVFPEDKETQAKLKKKGVANLPIRLKIGQHLAEHNGFGWMHILNHFDDFSRHSMSPLEYLHGMLQSRLKFYRENNQRLSVKGNPEFSKSGILVIEIQKGGSHYSIVSCYPVRNDYKPRGNELVTVGAVIRLLPSGLASQIQGSYPSVETTTGTHGASDKTRKPLVSESESRVNIYDISIVDKAGRAVYQEPVNSDISFSVVGERAGNWGLLKERAFKGRDDERLGVELDASKASIRPGVASRIQRRMEGAKEEKKTRFALQDVLDFPELYEAYPKLAKMPVHLASLGARGTRAWYNRLFMVKNKRSLSTSINIAVILPSPKS